MKGVLWGWLLALGGVFWVSMIGLDYFYLPFGNHNNSIPLEAVIIEDVLEQSYVSKYTYHLLAVSAIFGIAFYITRRYLKKNETKIINVKQKTVNEEWELDNTSMIEEDQTLEVDNEDDSNDNEKETQDSYITPPSVDVRELQARLREFEENLAMLKQKGERLVTHTEMQKKRWEELNAGDQ